MADEQLDVDRLLPGGHDPLEEIEAGGRGELEGRVLKKLSSSLQLDWPEPSELLTVGKFDALFYPPVRLVVQRVGYAFKDTLAAALGNPQSLAIYRKWKALRAELVDEEDGRPLALVTPWAGVKGRYAVFHNWGRNAEALTPHFVLALNGQAVGVLERFDDFVVRLDAGWAR